MNIGERMEEIMLEEGFVCCECVTGYAGGEFGGGHDADTGDVVCIPS